MAGRDGKDGIEEMRLRAGADGDDELEVPVLIAEINLQLSMAGGRGTRVKAYPVPNLFDIVPHEACFLDVLEWEAAICRVRMLPRPGN